jgi:xylulose-5-phosphate/fructose-6-phosphate phosphoketolase
MSSVFFFCFCLFYEINTDKWKSHINSEVPGAIHEGGELGYALAVSFGAVMDHPDLIVTCVIGDGEAESGPTAA